MKRIFIFFIFLAILALAVWLFFGRGSKPTDGGPLGGSPFGSAEDINIPALGTETVEKTTEFDQNISSDEEIFRISNTPTAGFVILSRGTTTLVRYLDRATGHIFDAALPNAGSGKTLEKTRVTNNTLPKIYEAHFRADGLAVLLRSLENDSDQIKNMTLTLTPPRSTSTEELYGVSATNLRGDLDSVLAVGANLFYVLKNNSSISSSPFTGTPTRTLFSSPFTNWRLSRLGANLLVFPKASASAAAPLYSLNALGGALTKILEPLNGLTALGNSSADRLIYSHSENNRTKFFVRNLRNNTGYEISPATLTEKCVWSTINTSIFFCGVPLSTLSANEPDDWYLGKSHYSDRLWRFNAERESASLVSQPKTDFGLDLDIYEPKLSSREDFLVFLNKRDMTLWTIRLD